MVIPQIITGRDIRFVLGTYHRKDFVLQNRTNSGCSGSFHKRCTTHIRPSEDILEEGIFERTGRLINLPWRTHYNGS